MGVEQIRANGISMGYRVDGLSSAPILLLSNGLATDMSMWDDQVAHFSSRYRIVRYDTRGHGDTPATAPPYTLSVLVEDLRSLLDALGANKVHFVGMSLGGMIGQLFAVRYPGRLLSLSLCDTAARMKRETWEGRIKQATVEGVAPLVEPSLVRWFTEPFRVTNPDLMDRVRRMINRTSTDGYVGCAGVVMAMDHVDHLARISTPTLVVVGRHDVSTPLSEAELMHANIAGSTLSVIEDASHLPNIEQAVEFNKILEAFLAAQDLAHRREAMQ